MKIYKVTCYIAGEGTLFGGDAIEFEGGLWLVPGWIEVPDQGWKAPARIIRLDGLDLQWHPGAPNGDATLDVALPRAVLFPEPNSPPAFGFEVRERPDVRVPIARGVH